MRFENEMDKNFSPNWQFVGKLKDVSTFVIQDKSYFLLKTATTAVAVEAILTGPIHIGQTVKLSKRDSAVKIGKNFFYRPEECMIMEIEEQEEDNMELHA